ncbi:MAG: TerB family tellurite resistance protein [Deltaproteobacteria bacterium]|nr:TerB family tellurite resistance protein [Deltaproteobacteria bacterium]
MGTDLEDFASTLPEDERNALLASIPMLIAMVAGADETFQDDELVAAVDSLLAASAQLGEQFRYSEAAQQEFDTLARHVRREVDRDDFRRLMHLRTAVHKMPQALREQYLAFASRVCIDIARADGSFLWFGNPISEAEAVVVRRIVAALGLPISDDVRALIEDAIDSA